MPLDIVTVPCLSDNYAYLVNGPDGVAVIDAPEAGPIMCISEPIHFSDTPCRFEPMPRIGQDNDYVYGRLLGLSADEIEALKDEGVLV